MLLTSESTPAGSQLASQSRDAALRAASIAGIRVVDEATMDRLTEIAALFVTVWGTSPHGAPIPVDLLRSFNHAGCNVTAAYDTNGALCGAAVAIVSPDEPSMYSLIAGVKPGLADAGVGFALKQHQRAWGLARGLKTMTWTFDPLVSRNARFNLTKLGAHSSEFLQNFYGLMDDEINSNDESDRLVATWPLASNLAIACSEGNSPQLELPPFSLADVRAQGPDGHPVLVEADDSWWCRVPEDIVSLRTQNPDEAAAWRHCIREIFTTKFSAGFTARGVTRSGWYRLTSGGQA